MIVLGLESLFIAFSLQQSMTAMFSQQMFVNATCLRFELLTHRTFALE